jgi:hypothetical protein
MVLLMSKPGAMLMRSLIMVSLTKHSSTSSDILAAVKQAMLTDQTTQGTVVGFSSGKSLLSLLRIQG